MPTRVRFGLVLVAAVLAAVVVVPGAGAEQAGSKAKRLPAGFLDADRSHTCVRLGTRQTRCWGLGSSGRLGYGNVTTIGDNETPASVGPVGVGSGRRAAVIAVGGAHTCAILDNRSVRCWGDGADGRLGYGNTSSVGDNETPGSVGPVDLGPGRKAVAISAGGRHTCAILDTGRVRCWGFNYYGQLGYRLVIGNVGDDETPGSVNPVNLGAGRRAVAIAVGGAHTCAILDTGAVRCWGFGGVGRLGYGNTANVGDDEAPGSVGPVNLGAGRRAVAIAAGGQHTCAILDTGAVRCWGFGTYGQLGYGNTDHVGDDETPGSVGPVDLGPGRRAVAISAGAIHTCAILDTGAVRCWGHGLYGQLGYGNTDWIGDDETPASVGPVDLGSGRQAVAIATGDFHSCALLDTGRVRCFGYGGTGQLGYGNLTSIGDNEAPSSAGPVSAGGLVARKVRPTLALTVNPKRDRRAPFRLRASGRLSGFLADSATCSRKVVVKAKRGGKTVVRRPKLKLKLGAGRCTYAASFRVRFAGTWRVTARFAGNGSLRARSSRARWFRAG